MKLDFTLVDRYLSYVKAMEKAQSTVDITGRTLKSILTELCEHHGVQISSISVSGIESSVLYDWYSAMDQRGCVMTTKNFRVILLNQFLRWLFTLNNPATGKIVIDSDWSGILRCGKVVKQSSLPPEMQKRRAYSTEEVKTIINDCPGPNKVRDRAILAMLSGTGMRCSEICSLNMDQWERIRDEKSVLIKRKGGKWAVVEVPDFVIPYLKEYVDLRRVKKGYANKSAKEKEEFLASPLFISTHGNRMTQNTMYRSIRHKQENAGQAVGIHNYRHTVLSNMPSASLARDVAGHSSFAVTTVYTHTDRQERHQAVNNLPWAADLAK